MVVETLLLTGATGLGALLVRRLGFNPFRKELDVIPDETIETLAKEFENAETARRAEKEKAHDEYLFDLMTAAIALKNGKYVTFKGEHLTEEKVQQLISEHVGAKTGKEFIRRVKNQYGETTEETIARLIQDRDDYLEAALLPGKKGISGLAQAEERAFANKNYDQLQRTHVKWEGTGIGTANPKAQKLARFKRTYVMGQTDPL